MDQTDPDGAAVAGSIRGDGAPLVSIGLNCYKAERWIGQCLDALLAQTLQDFEIIVSDNASPDRTVEICREYAARDPRIRVYTSDHNMGVAANLNKVFSLARGEYFCWASANDYYAPTFLEDCVRPMQQDPTLGLVAPQIAVFENDVSDAQPDFKVYEGRGDDPCGRLVNLLNTINDGRFFRGVFRRSALMPLMPLSSRFGQDIVLIARVAAHCKLMLLDQPQPLYYERWAPGAVTHKVPSHQRIAHFEPVSGLRSYLFFRCRNLATMWRIALGSVQGTRNKLRMAAGMLGVTYRWRGEPYRDLYDIAGLVRGYLRSWRGRAD